MNVQAPESLKPGEARCPGPSTRDLILRDGWEVPAALIAEDYTFLGDEDMPYDRYTSPAFFQAEFDRMWNKVWQWACREEHIPEVGDHYVHDVGPYSILVARVAPDEVRAYWNSCLHRGTQLRPSDSVGNVMQFRCPFHGWTWNLDGSLKEIPCRWDFPKVTDDEFRLPQVKVARWGGFIFINMDENAGPLEDYLGPLADHLKDRWDLSRRYVAMHIQKILPANWKAAQEAFLEAYHVVETHQQSLAITSDANCQYDTFSDKVTRFVHTVGIQSPHYPVEQSQQEIIEKMRFAPRGVTLKEGETARATAAQFLRETMSEEFKVDLSGYSDSEMLDSIEYHLFPNMFFFPGVSLPMLYRFRPNGMDVDSAVFDLLLLRPLADGETAPEAPAPVKIGIKQSYTEVPGLNPLLGAVYDQDTMNLDMQQKGFKASRKAGQTLGNYQEVRIRRIHRTLDAYLNA
ncbi:aromatic ring-hydroxylating dioxygenase subunit alpha [Iodidimonas sp. SYSU 1G8]|uniref:aromatic ring-hydroxylating oxygenase subunit alpha n=1 Tax=Iodidimonas sp. SYSU 1G8 TaxID=3133967 RepID=UPI0031FF3100